MKFSTGFKFKSLVGKPAVYTFIVFLPFLVFYWQVPFLADMTIGNDYTGCTIQEQMELQYALAHGFFPLYVPGFHGGQTSAALTLGQLYHPFPHLASMLPGYWKGNALQWITLLRLLSLGLVQLGLFILLRRLRISTIFSFISRWRHTTMSLPISCQELGLNDSLTAAPSTTSIIIQPCGRNTRLASFRIARSASGSGR